MSQFLNYITKKQAGGDIGSLPGVLSLSKIQKDIQLQKEKKASKGPSISKWNPKPGEMERLQREKEARTAENSALLNRLAQNEHLSKFMENIVEPLAMLEAGYGAGQLAKAGIKKLMIKAPMHSEEILRGPVNWWEEPMFKKNNPGITPEQYINNTGKFGNSTVEEIDPSLIPFDKRALSREQYKKFMSEQRLNTRRYNNPFENLPGQEHGGVIVDPRGQWAHPGKDTIIPTSNGRITMKGVSYPVYGQDETGYGQIMMPGGEYSFPGKTIYEKPLDMFNYEMAYGGQMIRRADGSYSQRGLWDNIRANRGSGKKPTKEMLEQERKIKAAEARYGMEVYQQGGEPDGEMALGQINAAIDKLTKLREFIQPTTDLEPWVSSKLTMLDHYSDAVSDFMMYNPEAQEMAEEMEMMKNGGYTVTRSNDRKGKTHKVTGPDGTVKYFGDSKLGQHPKDPERKKAFYARHKKNLDRNPYFRAFARATWANGGQIEQMANGGYIGYDGKRHMSTTPTWSGNAGYEMGGYIPEFAGGGGYCFECGGSVYKNGGGINIDPKNKGKFTASAKRAGMGVQEFAAHVLANKDDYSSTQVKRANFARNASKWNKQQGGPVEGDEMDVTPEELELLRAQGYEFEII